MGRLVLCDVPKSIFGEIPGDLHIPIKNTGEHGRAGTEDVDSIATVIPASVEDSSRAVDHATLASESKYSG